jgi:hypothetical protein
LIDTAVIIDWNPPAAERSTLEWIVEIDLRQSAPRKKWLKMKAMNGLRLDGEPLVG